jgi:hypothetical protein
LDIDEGAAKDSDKTAEAKRRKRRAADGSATAKAITPGCKSFAADSDGSIAG